MASLLARHYAALRDRPAHAATTVPLGDLAPGTAATAFVSTDGGAAVAAHIAAGDPVRFTVGITPTGPPHAGTYGQLRLAARLQSVGLPVQVVIADLAAELAGGRPRSVVDARTRRYRRFATAAGLDPAAVRSQREASDVLRTAMTIAPHLPADRPTPPTTAFDAALATAYEDAATPDQDRPPIVESLTSLLLHADTLDPLVRDDAAATALVVGADNHGLVPRFRALLDRSPWTGTVAGFYTPLVPGLAGAPKASKSLPADGLALTRAPSTIAATIEALSPGPDVAADPVIAVARLCGLAAPQSLQAIRAIHPTPSPAWRALRTHVGHTLAAAARTWQTTGADA